MPAEPDGIVYYGSPVRPYVDYYCPITEEDAHETDEPTQAPAEMPRQRTLIPSPRSARVRPYVFAYTTNFGEQRTLPLGPDMPCTQVGESVEEEYTPERLERLASAHRQARQHSGGFASASPSLLQEIMRGLERL